MLSVSAFAASLPGPLLRTFSAALDWPLDAATFGAPSARERGRIASAALDSLPSPAKDKIRRELERCEMVSRGGPAVLFSACGDDSHLRSLLNGQTNDRSRAALLYCQALTEGMDSVPFKRAEFLLQCGAGRPGGRSWRLYTLDSIRRDWAPHEKVDADLKGKIEQELLNMEGVKRSAHTEVFSRPALYMQSDGPLAWCFLVNASCAESSESVWHGGELTETAFIPNRSFVMVVQPHARTLEIGHADAESADALQLGQMFAHELCGQRGDLKPLTHGAFVLDGLGKRRSFITLPEHRISRVSVKKLVVMRGPGTCTYHVPARQAEDVYDLIGVKARGFAKGSVLSARLRVEFESPGAGKKTETVTFDITRPNKCTLRNDKEREALLLSEYIEAWGLGAPTDRRVPVYSIREVFRPFSDLFNAETDDFRREEIASLAGDAEAFFLDTGMLREDGKFASIICSVCGAFHDCSDLSLFTEVMVACPQQGVHQLTSELAARFVTDARAAATLLAKLLHTDSRHARILPDGETFYLGQSAQDPDWRAYFAPGLRGAERLDETIKCLKDAPLKDRGILIVTAPLPKDLILPGRLNPVEADRLLTWNGKRFDIEAGVLERSLIGKEPPRKRGPKALDSEAKDLRDLCSRFGDQPGNKLELAKKIRSFLAALYPDRTIPAAEHIRDKWLNS